MPLVDSSYSPPPGFSNGHLQTIFPALFRRVEVLTTRRQRIETPDGDFLDLDWTPALDSDRLAIISHGLEGASDNACVQGMARAFHRRGWGVLAWNLRGCSGEPNRLLRSYHSGSTDDLQRVLETVPDSVRRVALLGFSLGGNITLKYLGNSGDSADPRLVAAAVFSVPCDLAASARQLETPLNRAIYMRHFLIALRRKVRAKAVAFPSQVNLQGLETMSTFREFDGAFTAPWNGYASANDYWQRASSKPVLDRIRVPTLLVNARNDPFLPEECFPTDAARGSRFFHFEAPQSGGHTGFIRFGPRQEYWSESRAADFVASQG